MHGMKKPAPVTLAFNACGVNLSASDAAMPEQPVRFAGVAYSGGVIPAYGWMGDVAIDLSTLQNADGAEIPVLVDHSATVDGIAGKGRIRKSTSPAGVTELHIEGELTPSTEAGQRIARLLAEGFPLQLSVGMSANLRELKEPIDINGHRVKVAAVFENPHIRETSFVPTGADPGTSVARFSFAQTPTFNPASSTPSQEPSPMTRTPEDQALIDGLQTQLAALQTQVAAAATAQRSEQFAALCRDIGREAVPTGDALKPYLDMTDATFAAYCADLRAEHQRFTAANRTHTAALFGSTSAAKAQSQQAAGTDPGKSPLMQAVSLRIAQTTRA